MGDQRCPMCAPNKGWITADAFEFDSSIKVVCPMCHGEGNGEQPIHREATREELLPVLRENAEAYGLLLIDAARLRRLLVEAYTEGDDDHDANQGTIFWRTDTARIAADRMLATLRRELDGGTIRE